MSPPNGSYGFGKYWLIFIEWNCIEENSLNVIFIYPAIKWIIIYFPFDIQLVSFSSNYFFYPKFLLGFFLQFFSWNVLIISSSLRSLMTYVHGTVFLTFLITKSSSDQFGVCPLAKLFLYFHILAWSPTWNIVSLSLTCLIELIYTLFLRSTVFILIVLWYVLLYSFTISSNFWYWSHVFVDFNF